MNSTQTVTITNKQLILKLRVKRVTWDPRVIDNEHLNRKKTNCCCFKKCKDTQFKSREIKI